MIYYARSTSLNNSMYFWDTLGRNAKKRTSHLGIHVKLLEDFILISRIQTRGTELGGVKSLMIFLKPSPKKGERRSQRPLKGSRRLFGKGLYGGSGWRGGSGRGREDAKCPATAPSSTRCLWTFWKRPMGTARCLFWGIFGKVAIVLFDSVCEFYNVLYRFYDKLNETNPTLGSRYVCFTFHKVLFSVFGSIYRCERNKCCYCIFGIHAFLFDLHQILLMLPSKKMAASHGCRSVPTWETKKSPCLLVH